MIEVWYDVYNGKNKLYETPSKDEALEMVIMENLRSRTKTWTYRLRREQVNLVVLLAAPSSYS